MRSAQKKTPAGEKKNGKEQTSGKKLVQARLPFKIVAGAVPSSPLDAAKIETPPKKRKLSYDDPSENPTKKVGKSECKENSTDKEEKDSLTEEVIVLDDEPEKESEPKTPTSATTFKRSKKSTSHSAGKSNTPKVQIKLPLSGKKKRRKIDLTPRSGKEASDSSDVEIVGDEKTPKKIKLSESQENVNKDSTSVAEKKTVPSTKSDNETQKTESPPNKKSPKKETSRVEGKKETVGSRQDDNEAAEAESSPIKKSPKEENYKQEGKKETVALRKDDNESPETESSPNKKSPKNETPQEEGKNETVASRKIVHETPETESSPNRKSAKKEGSKQEGKKETVASRKYDHETPESSPNKKSARKESSKQEGKKETVAPRKDDNETPETESSSNKEKESETSEDTAQNTTVSDKDLHDSPSTNDRTDDTADLTTPVHQKNLRVSIKRLRSPKQKGKSEVETKDEEQSFSQNLENGGNLNTEEISSSGTEDEMDKSTLGDTSTSSIGKKVLTPKQVKLMEHRKKAKEEKERKLIQLKEEKNRRLQEQREERERKLQEEKIQKQKEREERELQRKKEREEKDEQKRREKEEKEEQKRKEKEDKERKRLAEIEAKNEEKRKKDEAKEEERRKKEEDRRRKELEKEEEENKKKKAAQAFTKFFVPKNVKPCSEEDQESKDDMEVTDCLAFRPFQVKGDMKLAPLVRREFNKSSREALDSLLTDAPSPNSTLYLAELKNGEHVPLKGCKTVLKENDDDVVIIENELETAAEEISEMRPKTSEKCRAKFFFFRENRRPPYYGTWRKRSSVITARRPFASDKGFFDYEVDSDEEWEEEEPGESLNGSEDEKEESEDEDYEVDNEWFVPHGHLSDEELQNEDELGPDTSREAQKAKLKALQQEFAQEMKKKTEKIKPRLFGAIWEDENGNKPKLCPEIIWETLCARAMIVCETPLVEEPPVPESEPSTPPPEKQRRIEINDDLMAVLIRLVHGNRHSRAFLIKEFIEHVRKTCETVKSGECLAPTKALIKEKIDEISEWSVLDDVNKSKKKKKKLCWVVSADVLSKYSLDTLGLRNEWSYTLQPKFDSTQKPPSVTEANDEVPVSEKQEEPKSDESAKKKLNFTGITKFAKVLTTEEKKKILSRDSFDANGLTKSPKIGVSKTAVQTASQKTKGDEASAPSTAPVVKKRVPLLMSVPPGQDFPAKSKNALISKFLEANKPKTTSGRPDAKANSYLQTDDDDAVIIE